MHKPVIGRLAGGIAVLAVAAVGCSSGNDAGTKPSSSNATHTTRTPPPSTAAVIWPAPPDPLTRTVAAGLKPEVKEILIHHVHAHLDVFVDGKPVTVPAGIGINIKDPGVKRFTDTPDGSFAYGGITGCRTPCISPLHTHDTTGILHTESASPAPNTLGQFFTEWGVRLSRSCVQQNCSPKPVAFYVNGKRSSVDPRTIKLTDQEEIAVVIGTPPTRIPSTADFSMA